MQPLEISDSVPTIVNALLLSHPDRASPFVLRGICFQMSPELVSAYIFVGLDKADAATRCSLCVTLCRLMIGAPPTVTGRPPLQGLPFVTADGKQIKKHTKIYMSTTPLGGFCIEAESPGTLAQQRSFYIADYSSKHLTYALLDRFMGPGALDPVAQLDIGACFLYFANGFKLTDAENKPGRIEESVSLVKHSDDYFHPMGYLMAPEGKSVPGLQPDAAPPSVPTDPPAVADDSAHAPPVPQAAAITLARFSLPRVRPAATRLQAGVDGGSVHRRIMPGRALQGLWARLTQGSQASR